MNPFRSANRTLRVITYALVMTALACQANGGPPVDADPEPPLSDQELSLSVAEQNHISGGFRYGKTAIAFELTASETVQRLVVRDAAGRDLLVHTQTGDMLSMSVFDGAASMFVDMAKVRESQQLTEVPEGERRPFVVDGSVLQFGDQAEFERFESVPEATALAWLSRALGMRGYTGRDYPVTLRLHVLASNIADSRQLKIPSGEANNRGTAGSAAHAARPDGACEDLRGDPHHNDAYGMCGPGKSCWEWTCGDCCCHDGCKSHDWTCRNCHWYTPWNCTLCATFTSMMAGGCGTSCQERTYAQPCIIGPYEPCNGRCMCAGSFDGSSEAGAAGVQWGCRQQTDCDPGDPNCDSQLYCMPM